MESQLNFLATRGTSPASAASPVSPAAADNPASAAPTKVGADGRGFFEVLTGETLKTQRQHFAALGAQDALLQVVPLGNNLNVITSDAPLPSMESLAQFARQQGLHEAAVQALFGPSMVTPLSAVNTSPAPANPTHSPSESPSTNPKTTAATGAFLAPVANLETAMLVTPSGSLAPQGAMQWAAPAPATLALPVAQLDDRQGPRETVVAQATPEAPWGFALAAPVVALGVAATPAPDPRIQTCQQGGGSSAGLQATALAGASLASAANIELAILATPSGDLAPLAARPSPSAQAAPLAALGSAPDPTARVLLAASAAAAVNAHAPAPQANAPEVLRLSLVVAAPDITQRLAQMSGTGKESPWAALLASGPLAKALATPALDTLHLEVPPDYDLAPGVPSAMDMPANTTDLALLGGSAMPPLVAQADAGSDADSNTNNAQAQTEQRAQQFQHMANQMGQAAAQRLIAQIERGQWKLQMRMQPAALGSIHVELDMHAGGLDALFSADSAVTRELMVQGHHKLRDTLADAGMTVASITVNGDQSRQSGGNSTPGKGRASALGKGSVGGASASAVPAATTDGATQTDGLNVLA